MNTAEYTRLMKFPPEWAAWKLLPEAFLGEAARRYRPGDEDGPEHDRNAVFCWWLKQAPSAEVLEKLMALAWLDPDPVLGADVRRRISALGAVS